MSGAGPIQIASPASVRGRCGYWNQPASALVAEEAFAVSIDGVSDETGFATFSRIGRAAATAMPATAQRLGQYPWCSRYAEPTGVTSCSFNTYGQCMQMVSGIDGYCYRNPSYEHVKRR